MTDLQVRRRATGFLYWWLSKKKSVKTTKVETAYKEYLEYIKINGEL